LPSSSTGAPVARASTSASRPQNTKSALPSIESECTQRVAFDESASRRRANSTIASPTSSLEVAGPSATVIST
jgi:hypothetical protein